MYLLYLSYPRGSSFGANATLANCSSFRKEIAMKKFFAYAHAGPAFAKNFFYNSISGGLAGTKGD